MTEQRWRWDNGELVVFEKWDQLNHQINIETTVPILRLATYLWNLDLMYQDSGSVTCEKEYGKGPPINHIHAIWTPSPLFSCDMPCLRPLNIVSREISVVTYLTQRVTGPSR